MIRILGVDPGSRRTGYGIIEVQGNQARQVESGVLRLEHLQIPERLGKIYQELTALIEKWSPHCLSIEKVFVHKNPESALKLGQARGVAICAAANQNLAVHEYAAREIKLATVGYGNASKQQVQHMTRILLGLREMPLEDAADALAAALCHMQQSGGMTRLLLQREARKGAKA